MATSSVINSQPTCESGSGTTGAWLLADWLVSSAIESLFRAVTKSCTAVAGSLIQVPEIPTKSLPCSGSYRRSGDQRGIYWRKRGGREENPKSKTDRQEDTRNQAKKKAKGQSRKSWLTTVQRTLKPPEIGQETLTNQEKGLKEDLTNHRELERKDIDDLPSHLLSTVYHTTLHKIWISY